MMSRDSSGWNWLVAICLAALALASPSASTSISASASASTSPGASDRQSPSGLPSERQWHRDVRRAMRGSHHYIDQATEGKRDRLAVNFDIDNSALATSYRPGTATPTVYPFALYAHQHGVALMFNTARTGAMLRKAKGLLTHAGYPVTELCGRRRGEDLRHSKQRCRRHFITQGYTIIANIGNRSTDFYGKKNYGRVFRLPNYGGLLG